MKGKKTILDKYNYAWEGGKTIEVEHPKVAYFVRNSCLTQINAYLKKTSCNLSDEDKKKLIGMITEVKNEKAKLGEDYKCTVEEYQEFLNVYFHNLDQEDRHKTVTMKTSYRFRLMSEFIDFLTEFEPLNDDIKKLQKYCKFKTVDITKSLKKGEVPKRGGPKEEEERDELNQEIEEMSFKQKQETVSLGGDQGKVGEFSGNNFNMTNADQQQQLHFQQQQLPFQQQPQNTFSNPYLNNNQEAFSLDTNQQLGDYSLKKLTPSDNNNLNQNKFINTPQPNTNNVTLHQAQTQGFKNISQTFQNGAQFNTPQNNPNKFQAQNLPPYNSTMTQPSQIKPPQQPPQQPQQPPQQPPQKPPQKPQQPSTKKDTIKGEKVPDKDTDTRVKDKKTGISVDPKDPNKRIITSKVTQVSIQVPVKIKSMDYYKLIDAIKKNTEVGLKECKKGKLPEALEIVESSLEYLKLITH